MPSGAAVAAGAVAPAAASTTVLSQQQMPGAAPVPQQEHLGVAHVASAGDAVEPQTLDGAAHVAVTRTTHAPSAARASTETPHGVALPAPQPAAAAVSYTHLTLPTTPYV